MCTMRILCHVGVQSKYGYTKEEPRSNAGFEIAWFSTLSGVYPKSGSVGVTVGVIVEVGVVIPGVGVIVRVGVLEGIGVRVIVGVLVGVPVEVGGGVAVGQGTFRELERSQVPQFGKVKVRSARNRPAIGSPFKSKSAIQY